MSLPNRVQNYVLFVHMSSDGPQTRGHLRVRVRAATRVRV